MDHRTESDPATPVDPTDTGSGFGPDPIIYAADYGDPNIGEQVARPLTSDDGWLVDLVNNFAGPSDRPRQLRLTLPITVSGVVDQCQTIQIEVVTQGDMPGEITGDPVSGQLACEQEQDNGTVQTPLQQECDVLNYQILNSSNNDAMVSFSSLQEENNIIQDDKPVVPECHNYPKIFTCSTCRKVFKKKSALTKHEIIHTGIKTQICHVCGKGFYFPYELKRHCRKNHIEIIQHELETLRKIAKQTIQQSSFLQEDQKTIQDCETVIVEQSSTSSNSNQYVTTQTSNTDIYNSLSDISIYNDTPLEHIFNSSSNNTESEHLISSSTQNNNIDTHKADTVDYDITNANDIPMQFILNYTPDEYTENTKYLESSSTQEHGNTEIEITDNQENDKFTLSSLDAFQMIEHDSGIQTHTFNTNISDPLKNSLKDNNPLGETNVFENDQISMNVEPYTNEEPVDIYNNIEQYFGEVVTENHHNVNDAKHVSSNIYHTDLNNTNIQTQEFDVLKEENIVPITTCLKNDAEKKIIYSEEFRAKRAKIGFMNTSENDETFSDIYDAKTEAIIKECNQTTSEHFDGQIRKLEVEEGQNLTNSKDISSETLKSSHEDRNNENDKFIFSSLDAFQMIEHDSGNQTPHTSNTNISDPLKNSLKDFLNFLPDKTKSKTLKSSNEDRNNVKTKKQISTEPKIIKIETASDGTKLFYCPKCNKIYKQKTHLERHLMEHKIERNFICDICGAVSKRKSDLNRHKTCHNPDLPFVCNICFKGFKRRYSLNLHVKIH